MPGGCSATHPGGGEHPEHTLDGNIHWLKLGFVSDDGASSTVSAAGFRSLLTGSARP
jgi:hypothetical protein